MQLVTLANKVTKCTLCATELKLGVRPVLQVHTQSKILIAGQAPGSKVHKTGVPFDDPSGDRLREWMGVDRESFYDARQIAILPMGFCYPGKGKSGDLPPIPRCAQTWRNDLMDRMPNIKLTLVIGQYAQAWHLEKKSKTVTETVRNWNNYDASVIPLPHPSPRNNIWIKKNAWFGTELIPVIRSRVAAALGSS